MVRWPPIYVAPPVHGVELGDFERLGEQRVRLLADVSAITEDRLARLHYKDVPLNTLKRLQFFDRYPADDISAHYILRLSFLQADEWRWFVQNETKLFLLRLARLPPTSFSSFLHTMDLHYDCISVHDPTFTSEDREWMEVSISHLYKVPFTEASRVLRDRSCILRHGYCYLPPSDLLHIATHHFRQGLMRALKIAKASLPLHRQELSRLHPYITALRSKIPKSTSFMEVGSMQQVSIKPATIDQFANRHFPLCMRHLHQKLREKHHLKYDGRIQYRMFLKGVGFSVEESMLFFREEFLHTMESSEFERKYAYHIRHSYGLEGSRKDYLPLSCDKIIRSLNPPRQGQYHGCPFRHWDASTLRTRLVAEGTSNSEAIRIEQTRTGGHYIEACWQFFDATHPFTGFNVERDPHPNAWLQASLQSR